MDTKRKERPLHITYYNINGLANKKIDFYNDFLMLNSDVFCFSETHLQTCFNYSIIQEKYEVGEVFGEKQMSKGRAAMGFIVGWKKDVFTKSNFVIENQHVIRLE